MEYPASKTRALDIAFVVDADTLKRLAAILGGMSAPLEYTVKFSDGTSVRYDNIEDVIGQPNSSKRSIVSLIAGTADEKVKSAYVNLKKTSSPSLEYTINGTQHDVIYLADQLDDWVAAVRQWYTTSTAPGGFYLVFLAILLPLFIGAFLGLLKVDVQQQLDVQHSLGFFALALVLYVVEYFIFLLFPRGTFAIGRGKERHRFNTYARRAVAVMIAGVVVRLITKR
jgi:hypothetical protein